MSRAPILHLCDSPFVGGPEKQILGQCRHIDRSRFEPIIASFTVSASQGNDLIRTASESGIRTAQLSDGKLTFPLAVRQLSDFVRSQQIKLIVSHGFKADFTAAAACALAAIPYVAYFHGRTAATLRVRLYESLDLRAMRRARVVVTVCQSIADYFRSCCLNRVEVIPNAVEVNEIAVEGTRGRARAELGIKSNELVVGTVVRLSVEKGLDYLIDAAPKILSRFPSARFVIIGNGPMRHLLARRAENLGVAGRFIFTGHREDCVALMKALDVFVLPSIRENMPVSLLEAMACGIGVVATDVGGVREVLEPAGVEPIPARSSEAIAEAVIAILNDDELRACQSSALIRRVGDYSFERQSRLVEDLLCRCVAGGGGTIMQAEQ